MTVDSTTLSSKRKYSGTASANSDVGSAPGVTNAAPAMHSTTACRR
jgi:hypothetical protein